MRKGYKWKPDEEKNPSCFKDSRKVKIIKDAARKVSSSSSKSILVRRGQS